jgi:CO/xanthine dehydrogenase Mo-binding subunit
MTEMLNKEFSRKRFVKGGGAMVVGMAVGGAAIAGKTHAAESPFTSNGPSDLQAADSFLTIHADNTATLRSGRVELGQGSSVGLVMIAAEELDMAVSQIAFVNPDTNTSPNTGATTASSSIASAGPRVRAAAAYARQALLAMAAAQLGVSAASLTVANGVVSGGGRSVKYGDLVGGKLLNVSMPTATLNAGQAPAKAVAQYKVVATEVPRFDIPDKVTGKFTFVQNVRVPGMLHARVVRPRGQGAYPSGAPVVSVDDSSIRHLSGARVVRKGDFIAVVAPHEFIAIQAASQLKVKWADPPTMAGSGNFFKQMRDFDAAGKAPARIQSDSGNVDSAFATAPVKIAASRYVHHYTGHMPIGPSCAVADVRSNGAVIYSNTQNAYGTRTNVQLITGLPLNAIRIRYFEGSGMFGPTVYEDCAIAAALTSQLAGAPVRLQFMRWDEHGYDYSGIPLQAELRGAVDANGKIVAHEYTAFGQPSTGLNQLTQQLTGTAVPTPGLGSAETGNTLQEYAIANRRVVAKSLPLFNNYLKTSPLRGIGSVQAHFALEQFMDELAYAAKLDPVEFRRRNLNDTGDLGPRFRTVLEAAAKLANWQPKVSASSLKGGTIVTGRGFALGTISNVPTTAAVVADIEVNKQTGKILVKDLWAAENAGLSVSPGTMENQVIGAQIHGVSRALNEQVRFDTHRVTSLDWVGYGTLRFKDSPRVHPTIVQQRDLQPTGSGEPSLIPVGPAIANAFFDATGVRLREAPMTPARVRAALKAAGVV